MRIYSPGPRSTRFPFGGLGACCPSCARGGPCDSGLGQKPAAPSGGGGTYRPVGSATSIPGYNQLDDAITRVLSDNEIDRLVGLPFDNARYAAAIRKLNAGRSGTQVRLTNLEARAIIIGTLSKVWAAVARAKLYAESGVYGRDPRLQPLVQADIAAAATLLNTLPPFMQSMRAAGVSPGTGGLGFFFMPGIFSLVTIGVVQWVVVSAVLGSRLLSGTAISDRQTEILVGYCERTGCTNEELIALINEINRGNPFNRAIDAGHDIIKSVGESVDNALEGAMEPFKKVALYLGIGGGVLLGGYLLFTFWPALSGLATTTRRSGSAWASRRERRAAGTRATLTG